MLAKMRCLMLATLAAVAAVAQTSAANAYTYSVTNNTSQVVVYINLHTVSAFCHDVEWKGRLAPLKKLYLHSASICLVDGAYAQGESGRGLRWSGIGVTGGNFYACNGSLCRGDKAWDQFRRDVEYDKTVGGR